MPRMASAQLAMWSRCTTWLSPLVQRSFHGRSLESPRKRDCGGPRVSIRLGESSAAKDNFCFVERISDIRLDWKFTLDRTLPVARLSCPRRLLLRCHRICFARRIKSRFAARWCPARCHADPNEPRPGALRFHVPWQRITVGGSLPDARRSAAISSWTRLFE